MDIPLFSGSLLQNQCQGKWRLNLEKASKSLTVIVVNSSPGPGSFSYCKSLHLPELLTSKSFYCRPLRASLMCVSLCFNINIPHTCPDVYRKPRMEDCTCCLEGFYIMATSLIQMKAWWHKRSLKDHFHFFLCACVTVWTCRCTVQILAQHFHASQKLRASGSNWMIAGGE